LVSQLEVSISESVTVIVGPTVESVAETELVGPTVKSVAETETNDEHESSAAVILIVVRM